jgi:hypothetical protein
MSVEALGGEPKDEAKHFIKCPVCGGLIDRPHPAKPQ